MPIKVVSTAYTVLSGNETSHTLQYIYILTVYTTLLYNYFYSTMQSRYEARDARLTVMYVPLSGFFYTLSELQAY